MARKKAEEIEILEEIIEQDEEYKKPKVENKKKQVRYIFQAEDGWYEKERDNRRITKYYRTQEEAIESARKHIKNSGMPGSIVIQSRKGRIRANKKVSAD